MNKSLSDLLKIFKSGVSAVLPQNVMKKSLNFNETTHSLTILEDSYDVRNKKVYVVGTGKAVKHMASETEKVLGSKIQYGIISIPEGNLDTRLDSKLTFYEGAKNNLPDKNAENTAIKVKELVSSLGAHDFLLLLISGGGSALLPLAKHPATLEDKTNLIKNLANSGADIMELNTVRKHLSELKGGKLAILAQPAKVVSLILSDIVGDPIDLIAGGPTAENFDDPSKAKEILKKYNLYDNAPESIRSSLEKTKVENEEFPRNNVKNYIIGSNKLSIQSALEEADALNYNSIYLSNSVTGNVNVIAKKYTELTKNICDVLSGKQNLKSAVQIIQNLGISGEDVNKINVSSVDKQICFILGGETTVEVKGTGKGGRNQHLALEFSKQLHDARSELNGFNIYLLSAGTDGIDGPTNAAGAIGYLDLVSESQKQGLNIQDYLNNNDSYNFFKLFKDGKLHVMTGHTNTNVMDLHLIVIEKK